MKSGFSVFVSFGMHAFYLSLFTKIDMFNQAKGGMISKEMGQERLDKRVVDFFSLLNIALHTSLRAKRIFSKGGSAGDDFCEERYSHLFISI